MLQLEATRIVRDAQTGKWAEDDPPDFMLALMSFESELQAAITRSRDERFAHSIATALVSDAMILDLANPEDRQSVQDRQIAMSLHTGETRTAANGNLEWQFAAGAESIWGDMTDTASGVSIESGSTVAGPSGYRADRSMTSSEADHVNCSVCAEPTRCHDMVRLSCGAHGGACPADDGRQSFIAFAEGAGWRACFGCGEMVSRDEGCDHMTCRCRAEFCYRCGVKWKGCQCGDWEPELLGQRAQQVVDREAPGLLPAARQRRVAAMERELQATHECDHSGKFTKIDGSRRGKTAGGTEFRIVVLQRLAQPGGGPT
ncbi:hypothetical protein PWT90_06637 [Aphanocladium album]|nr:hypothetical protein PWT90_06637 [Aphanocladium album]